MCTPLYFYLNVPYSLLTTKNIVSVHHLKVNPLYPFHCYPSPSSSGNPYCVLCIYVFVFKQKCLKCINELIKM